ATQHHRFSVSPERKQRQRSRADGTRQKGTVVELFGEAEGCFAPLERSLHVGAVTEHARDGVGETSPNEGIAVAHEFVGPFTALHGLVRTTEKGELIRELGYGHARGVDVIE